VAEINRVATRYLNIEGLGQLAQLADGHNRDGERTWQAGAASSAARSSRLQQTPGGHRCIAT